MRKYILISIILLSGLECLAQSSKVFRLIRKENFELAESYGLAKLDELTEKDKERRLSLMLALGRLYEILGDLPEANKYLTDALSIVEEKYDSGDKLKLMDFDVVDEYALFSIKAGNLVAANKWIDFSIEQRVGDFFKNNPTNFRPYLAKGLLLYTRNQLDSAEFFLKEYAFNIRNSNYTGHLEVNRYADAYQILSDIALNKGELKKARHYAKKAARLQNHSWTKRESGRNTVKRVLALNTVSEVYYNMGRLGRAQAFNDWAYKLYLRNINTDLPVLTDILVTRSFLHLEKKDITGIKRLISRASTNEIDFIQKNFSVLSEYEKENFQIRHKHLFNEMNRVMINALSDSLIHQDDPFWIEVLDYNSRTKGLILNESTRLYKTSDIFNDSLKNEYEAWKLLKNQYAFMVSSRKYKADFETLETLENEIINYEKVLLNALPSSSVDSMNLTGILQNLRPTDKIVELLRVDMTKPVKNKSGEWENKEDSQYIVFKLDKSGLNEISIVENGLDLENRFINLYNNSIKFKVRDSLSYSAFWDPLNIEENRWGKIYFSPDGIYNLVNLDNLWNPEQNKYLFEESELINITSIRRLSEVSKITTDLNLEACLVGNPDFSSWGMYAPDPLPETAIEVTEIEVMLNSHDGNSRVLMGTHANEKELKNLEGCPILHLATHGIFKQEVGSRNPMLNSGLLLSGLPDEGEDGLLTAYEAAGLNLSDTRIAVLSACDTGLGEILSGEGVYGLQRAFEVNGVDFTLMSMWKVEDEATRRFMNFFYSTLVEKNSSPYEALNEARKQMISVYPEPYYWGAFKLIGSSME